jgi:hypothetical protein
VRNGNWRDPGFPKSGWVLINRIVPEAPQQCGVCQTSVCYTIHRLEHAGPPYRVVEAGKDCAWELTGGDLRTRAEREADALAKQEAAAAAQMVDYFERAQNCPWDYAAFANYGWSESQNGNPVRRLAGGCVTLFRRDGGWKSAIILDEIDRKLFSAAVSPDVSSARLFAWRWLCALRPPAAVAA